MVNGVTWNFTKFSYQSEAFRIVSLIFRNFENLGFDVAVS